ncbi:hypothetical protein [Terrabacter sp. NPDC080008]|uniref:hypothetical protein n=1 Tax=Terrabacter sp. NPDC080008 TaxID=3155176 RepID=UPI00344D81F4
MALQRERVPAGAAALLAVLLAVPSVLAPTWHLTTLDSQGGVVLFDQQLWSWGRSRTLGAGDALVQDLWDPFGLVVLVLLLTLAAAAVVAWLLVRAAWVPVVAPLAWAALLGHLVSSAAQRHGRPVRDDVHGLAASGSTTLAGWLESVAALAAVVAVALAVVSLIGLRMPSAWLVRARSLLRLSDPDAAVRVGAPGLGPVDGVRPSASWRPPPEGAAGEQPALEPVPMGSEPAGESLPADVPRRVRGAAAALGAVGVLLAAATAVWPTAVIATRAPEVGDFTKGYEQRIWSWGRQAVYSSEGLRLDAYGGPDPWGRLVLLVAVLACAAAGLAWWVARSGRLGHVVAAVGTALALASVGGPLVERLSFDERSIGLLPGLVRFTTPVGWVEVAAVVVLALTLAVVVATARPGVAAALAGRLSAASARLRRGRRSSPVSTPATDGVRGRGTTRPIARLQDTARGSTTHTTSVGFSDDEGEQGSR